MKEPVDRGKQIGGSPLGRPQHKPEFPLPKISHTEFVEAQMDDKVKQALREADEEAKRLNQEGKIRKIPA
jgi:hypothetical protein